MILAIDFESVMEAGFTGKNTKMGDILNIRFEHNSGIAPANIAEQMHIVLHSDCILQITGSGVEVLD